jgi:hypothetical protein
MTDTLKKLLAVVALALVSVPAFAQSQPTVTTLSSAQVAPNAGSGSQQTISVASATGFTASTKSLQSFVLIDQELEEVQAISGTTITVRRNRQGIGTQHVSGALVIFGYTGRFDPNTGNVSTVVGSPTVGASVSGATFVSTLPVGSCTRGNNTILPVFHLTNQPTGGGQSYGYMVDCLNGKWIPGTLPEYPPNGSLILAQNVEFGNVAYGSLGNNTTGQNNKEFSSTIYLPKSGYVTGIKFMCGATCGTDTAVGLLRDTGGNIIANAAAAGVALSGASTFQTQAFTAKSLVVGPANYFCGIQLNGTAAGDIATFAASTWANVLANVVTVTFGTITGTITEPTTFTANTGPLCQVYY